ncbi:MAG TPA: hypothetical protein VN026_19065 [Bacteroidia bacterium]|nr:hypothetical protein [Bacteroidia bacterium]
MILAITGVLTQNLSKLIIFVNFEMNRTFIAKNLCEKKNERNNCCKGSCQLKKQLADDDKKEQAPSNNLKEVKEFQLFCQQQLPHAFILPLMFERNFITYQSTKTKGVAFSVFHPPC